VRNYTLAMGDLVGTSIAVFLRSLLPFTVLAIFVFSPSIALNAWMIENPPTTDAELRRHLPKLVGLVLLQALLHPLLAGSISYGVVQRLRGTPASFAATIANGLKAFGRVMLTAVLCWLRCVLFALPGFALFFILLLMGTQLAWFAALLAFPGLVEFFRLYVAVPATVLEGKGAFAAVERSKLLTKGSRGQLFGALVLVWALSWGLGLTITFASVLAGKVNEHTIAWVQLGFSIPLSAFGAVIPAVAYFMLRRGKENVDAAQIAAVFD
jgi:hypothetical protein